MVVCIGRGDISAFTQVPTDNKGNTPYVQLDSTHAYDPLYPDSGTALYAFASVAGGTGHVVAVSTVARDEVTLDATGPATLVAFWWGDGNQYFVHQAVPGDGFTLIDSLLPLGSYVQTAVAVKDVAAPGTYHITWDSGGNEGAQLWLVAVQSVTIPPTLQARVSGGSVVISWPGAADSYGLEMSSDLSSSNSWTPVTNAPVVVDFQNTVTNAISQPGQYYRLRKR